MKKSVTLFVALILAVTTSFGANTKKSYSVNNFKSVQLLGSPTVNIKQSSKFSVKAEGPQELLDNLDVFVSKGELVIKPKSNANKSNKRFINSHITIYVEMPKVSSLTLKGSGDIILRDKMDWTSKVSIFLAGSGDIKIKDLQTSSLDLALAGSGDIDIKTVKVDVFNSDLKGSGDIKIGEVQTGKLNSRLKGSGDISFVKGKANQSDYNVVGSGDISARNVEANAVIASISGSGDISCYAKKSLSGNVAGSGSVSYRGNPSQLEISKKGFSPIR